MDKEHSEENSEQRGEESNRDKKNSGEPGGGAGRVEDVHGSPVYPMSGPIPEGFQGEVKTMAEWGQGERGAEGYEDSGSSELSMMNGVEVGGWTEEDEENLEAQKGAGKSSGQS